MRVTLLAVCLLLPRCQQPETGADIATGEDVSEPAFEKPSPAVGGISVDPPGGTLEDLEYVRISFPENMVTKSDIGRKTPSPVILEPNGRYGFKWTSTREGILNVYGRGGVEVMRRLRLADGLKDLSGKPVEVEGWGAEFASDEMKILKLRFISPGGSLDEPQVRRSLGGTQKVSLSFSRDVQPLEVAPHLAFIDVRSKRRHPVRVAIDQERPDTPQGIVIVEPAEPLPMEREFWFVVERLEDYSGSHPLPHLRVFPAGRTAELKQTWARAYNQPRAGKFMRIGFNKPIDMATVATEDIRVHPPVAISGIVSEKSTMVIHADFKVGTEYELTIPESVLAEDGSVMDGSRKLYLEVPVRRPAIVVESQRVSVPVGVFDLGIQICRAKDIEWRIAEVGLENFDDVWKRLGEFARFATDDDGGYILDPRDDTVRYLETEFLIPALDLEVLARGEIENEDGENLSGRTVRWPERCASAGLYIIEFSGTDPDGRKIGNRALVDMKDWIIRKYASEAENMVHVARASDGSPVGGAKIHAYSWGDGPPEEFLTDAKGFANFGGNSPNRLMIEKHGVAVFHEITGDTDVSVWRSGEAEVPQTVFFTDGDIYQPGETVRFSGTVRIADEKGDLEIPSGGSAVLRIWSDVLDKGMPGFFPDTEDPNEVELALDEMGMVRGEYVIPSSALAGKYALSFSFGDRSETRPSRVPLVVADFRKPDVFAEIHAPVITGDNATVTVSSSHFHGAPQAGAKVKWRAEWLVKDWGMAMVDEEEGSEWEYHSFGDEFSPEVADQGIAGNIAALRARSAGLGAFESTVIPPFAIDRGEGVLDENGNLQVVSTCPFNPEKRGHRAEVFWVVEVRGIAGEVTREAARQRVQFADRILGLEAGEYDWGQIRIHTVSLDRNHERAEGFPVEIEVFHREVKVGKESIGKDLIRYRNTPSFKSVFKRTVNANETVDFKAEEEGDYVVVGVPVGMPGAPKVSSVVHGVYGGANGVVLDDFSAEAVSARPEWNVGEEAEIQVRSPITGWALVTVETDELLDTLPPVRMKGTADRIGVPVKAEYFPNCFVRIHIQNSGKDGGRPQERRALCELKVKNPNIELTVKPQLVNANVGPRNEVAGKVSVLALDRPVEGARVVMGAIDEALLSLGDWNVPDPVAALYPHRRHVFGSARAIDEGWYVFERGSLGQAQKGFIIGDGGDTGRIGGPPLVRENDRSRPFWQSDGVTSEDGTVEFSFKAPDQLTSYRVFAYAVADSGSAGKGSTRLRVTRPLRLKPFLPNFVREGDRFEMRCAIESDPESSGGKELEFAVRGERFISLESNETRRITIVPGRTSVVSVPATVELDSAGNDAVISFSATGPGGMSDSVKVRIPVKDAHLPRLDYRNGFLSGNSSLDVHTVFDGIAASEGSKCDFYLSGTRWIPKLVSMAGSGERTPPTVADKVGAALGALLMASMDAYLPERFSKRELALRNFQTMMIEIESSIIPDAGYGWLPRWTGGSEADGATTALVAIILQLADEEFGDRLYASENLRQAMNGWAREMLSASPTGFSETTRSAFMRCAALMLESKRGGWIEGNRLKAVTRDLYGFREELDLEAKCLLALADHALKSRDGEAIEVLDREETDRLLSEIRSEDAPAKFDPVTMASHARTEAIRLYTLSKLNAGMSQVGKNELARLLEPVLEGSMNLNEQENVWILLAAHSLMTLESPAEIAGRMADLPVEAEASPNSVTLAWLGHPASEIRNLLSEPLAPGVGSEWMIRVAHSEPVVEPLGDNALGLTRKLNNLTDSSRDGSEKAPLRIGDYVLLEYELVAGSDVYQLELVENLPSALETVNPDLPSVMRNFPVPPVVDSEVVDLSFVDRRAERVRLYFDHLTPGFRKYAILTRVVGAGDFNWPAATAVPMYDKRVRASTADGLVHASAGQ